ncbi:MAG: hypothetical protein WCK21_03040 [Actinomycetota bacterium]
MKPPASLAAAHAHFLEALTRVVDGKSELLAALAAAKGGDLDAVMNDVLVQSGLPDAFGAVTVACQALEDFSFARGGPRPCSAASDR